MNQFKWFLIFVIATAFVAGCLPNPLMESGKIAIKERDYERALRNLDSLVALDNANAEAWFLKGFAHEKLGQTIDMANAYQKSLSLSDAYKNPITHSIGIYVERYLTRFDTAYDASDWTLALALVDSAIILNPSDPILYHQAAVAALSAKDYDRSLNYALESIKREAPGEPNVRLRSLILSAYVEKNENDTTKMILLLDGHRSEFQFYVEKDKSDTVKIIDAAKELIAAVEIGYEKLKTLPDSQAVKEAERLSGFYLQSIDALVTAYEWQNLHAEASDAIAIAVLKYPENILLKQNYAALLIRQGKIDDALNVYREVIKTDPENVFANRAIGISLVDQKKYEEGIPYLLKVLEKAPNDLRAMQGLAGAYFNTGQDAKGKEYLDRIEAIGK